MPLTSKGQEIEKNMQQTYGPKKGEEVFYASRNAGKITGVDSVTGRADNGVIRNFDQMVSNYNVK